MDLSGLKKKAARAAVGLAAALTGLGATASATAPKLFTPADIQAIAGDAAAWSDLKAACDAHLDEVIDDCYNGQCYAGAGYRDAVKDYGLCYQVAKLNAPSSARAYARKTLALMEAISRDDPYYMPNAPQPLALGDGANKTFALPMAPMAGTGVRVWTAPTSQLTLTHGAVDRLPGGGYFPVVKVSNTSGGPADYAPSDTHVELGYDPNTGSFPVLRWLTGNHPASGAVYYATIADGPYSPVAAGNVSVSGAALTLSAAPAAGRAVFAALIGADYRQTGNSMGGIPTIIHDGPGYSMRNVNVGLAQGYDLVRDSPDFTPAQRTAFCAVLNGQVDLFGVLGYERSGPATGNYFIDGYLQGAMYTAFATDDDNPRAAEMKALAQTLVTMTRDEVDRNLPGGYGPQGTYSNGTDRDILSVMTVWKNVSGNDLLAPLEWTANLVPATVHGTKPDRATFYDGGDWNSMPATPLTVAMQAFVDRLPAHPMAPYARQLLKDVQGAAPPGAVSDYKASFPLSYRAKFTGPLYARSDWGTGAVWISFAAGPVFMDHQHQDQGSFTFQRGADDLVSDSGVYGARDSLPWHNTLGVDDRGAGDLIVYPNPPSQGVWGDKARITKYVDGTAFVYAQADITDAYASNDKTRNAVTRAVRTLVYVRPGVVLVHDQIQTADAGAKKYFSVNFNAASVNRAGGITSSVTGASKVFMRSLVPASPSPALIAAGTSVVDNHGASYPVSAVNYQVMASGRKADSFLHLFQLSASGQAAMAGSAYVQSSDGRAQGAEVDLGARRWVVLSASTAAVLSGGTLAYAVDNALNTGAAAACPCTHVVGDLPAGTSYQVSVQGPDNVISAATDANGVLTFSTDDPATTGVRVLLGGGVADVLPPARPRGLRKR